MINVNDINEEEVVYHHCYKLAPTEKRNNFPELKRVSVPKNEKAAMLAPVVLGVLVMLACLGFLACIAMTAWGFQLKKQNEKLKAQLRIIIEKKQIISGQKL